MNISKALSDANRVRMVLVLREGELCACQLTELLGLAPSTMSKHLSILCKAGLVNQRKDGRWVYYYRPGKEAPTPVREALKWMDLALTETDQIAADAKQLKKVLKINPTELCRKQCRL